MSQVRDEGEGVGNFDLRHLFSLLVHPAGGVRVRDLIFCLGTALIMKRQYVIAPSLESYTRLLEITCAESPFWKLQDIDDPVFEIG